MIEPKREIEEQLAERAAHDGYGDPTLESLIELANSGTMSLGVTLWVGGVVISGTLVGVSEYFEGVAGFVEGSGEGGAAIAGAYRKLAGTFHYEIGSQPEDVERFPTMIHLKAARVFSAGAAAMPRQGLWWRGRLDRVDGYSIGSLS